MEPWLSGQMEAVNQSGKLNKWAAIWTAGSILFSFASAVVQLVSN
jgi:hypothetical protein